MNRHVVVFEKLDVCPHVGDLVCCRSAKFENGDIDAVAWLGEDPPA